MRVRLKMRAFYDLGVGVAGVLCRASFPGGSRYRHRQELAAEEAASRAVQEVITPYIKGTTERRAPIGIYTLQRGSFPTILRQKATAGVSLAVAFNLVLQKNLSLGSASQF